MDLQSERLSSLSASNAVLKDVKEAESMRKRWESLLEQRVLIRSKIIQLQEEIDFTVYSMWGLVSEDLLSDGNWGDVKMDAGERPFDILRGESEDDFPVPSAIPSHWPADMHTCWQRRIEAISSSPELQLIEDPHYKRRWIGRQGLFNHTRNKGELKQAYEEWFLLRLETYFDFDGRMNDAAEESKGQVTLGEITMYSVAQLADAARRDPQFMEVGELCL